MKQLYCLKYKGDTSNLKDFQFDESFIVDKTGDEKTIVTIAGINYRMVDELPTPAEVDKIITIMGYVEAGKKENQLSNIKEDRKRLVGCIDSRFPILRKLEKGQKIVGYIKIQDMDCYVAITVKKSLIPIIASIAVVGIIICLVGLNLYNPVKTQQPADPSSFKTGEKGTGELSNESKSPMQTVYFNINLNATPTIKNGGMNLRVVNKDIVNSKENNLSCVVKVYLISTADEDGNPIEKFKEPLLIYESPLIHPSENIENCVLDIPVEPGRYVGRAMYDIYDSNLYLVGQTAARLDIVAK
jgi:hypothetical protein